MSTAEVWIGEVWLWRGTYLWARQSCQRPLEKQSERFFLVKSLLWRPACSTQSYSRRPLFFPCNKGRTGPFPPASSPPSMGIAQYSGTNPTEPEAITYILT